MRGLLASTCLALTVLASAGPSAAQQPRTAVGVSTAARAQLATALADARRQGDRDRDRFRHPAETLAFFRLEPGMSVVDFTPGSGWWTRVLVPYLGANGRYIALNPDARSNPQMAQYYGNTAQTFPPKAAEWTGVAADRIGAFNTDGIPETMNGTVDRVLVFRAIHNLFRTGMLHRELTAMRDLLKPNGLLGIEQHRARPNAPFEYANGTKGYMREKDVIALIEAHGFALVARSEVNANRADPANHPQGVWELPPNLRTKREELKPIGESDRMTLLFRKRP